MQIRSSFKRHWNERGMSLVEIMVAAGIGSVIFLGGAALMTQLKTSETKISADFWLEARRAEIANILKNDAFWDKLVAANLGGSSEMDCLVNIGSPGYQGCASLDKTVASRPLKIPLDHQDVSDPLPPTRFVDGTLPGMGISQLGEFCTSYDVSSADESCIYGIQATWRLVCGPDKTDPKAAFCRNPEAYIQVNFLKKTRTSATSFSQTALKLNIQFQRNKIVNSMSQVCQALNGTFTGTTCDLSAQIRQCDSANGFFLTGFNSQGEPQCTKLSFTNCPATKLISGFKTTDGDYLCVAGCP